MGAAEFNAGYPCNGLASHPGSRRNTPSCFMLLTETGISSGPMGHLARMQTIYMYMYIAMRHHSATAILTVVFVMSQSVDTVR